MFDFKAAGAEVQAGMRSQKSAVVGQGPAHGAKNLVIKQIAIRQKDRNQDTHDGRQEDQLT